MKEDRRASLPYPDHIKQTIEAKGRPGTPCNLQGLMVGLTCLNIRKPKDTWVKPALQARQTRP